MAKRYCCDMAMKKIIHEAARRISRTLIHNGCVIHRYDAFVSNSVYIKVDAGVVCSIRLSDHPGYEYRFNYMAQVPGDQVLCHSEGTLRFHYQSGAVDQLILDVLTLRQDRMELYADYQGLIKQNLEEGRKQDGFWQKAYCVNDMIIKEEAA